MATSVSYTSLSGKTILETEKAVRFIVHEISGSPIIPAVDWFPISRIQNRTKQAPGSEVLDTMMIESWLIDKFCEKNGI